MTDPTGPDNSSTPPTPPPAPTTPPPPPSPYGVYDAAPPAALGAPATIPGKTLGIVALVVAFPVGLVGGILGIIALVQSKNAGHKNGPALAAIIVGFVFFVVGTIITIVVISWLGQLALEVLEQCQQLGDGAHEINGVVVDCTTLLDR